MVLRISTDSGTILCAAGSLLERMGFTAADFPMKTGTFMDRLHPEDAEAVTVLLGQMSLKKRKRRREFRLLLSKDEPIWVQAILSSSPDPSGAMMIDGYLHDITERMELERELKDQLKLQEQLFATIPVPLVIKDTNSRFLQVTRPSPIRQHSHGENSRQGGPRSISPSSRYGLPEDARFSGQDDGTRTLSAGEGRTRAVDVAQVVQGPLWTAGVISSPRGGTWISRR